MSLYADYLRERTDDQIIETELGFVTYRFLNEKQAYIIDIYVVPEHRKLGAASGMADMVVEIAKRRGCTELIGTVVASAKGSDISLKVLQGYGMTLKSHSDSCIIMGKEI